MKARSRALCLDISGVDLDIFPGSPEYVHRTPQELGLKAQGYFPL